MQIEFDAPTHSYKIDGRRVPSVTQVLEPATDWSFIPAWQLEAARALGQDVHLAINLMVQQRLDWESVDPAVLPYVKGAALFLRDSGATVLASELVLGSARIGVAGTLDLLLQWGGWEYYADWKVSDTIPKTVGAQLSGYEILYADHYRNGRRNYRARRVSVRLKPNGYTVDRMKPQNGDEATFISHVNAYKLREQKRYG